MQKRIAFYEDVQTVGDLIKILETFNQDLEVENQFGELISVSLYEDAETKERTILIDGV
ncbi:hypothetical protein GWZ74_17225 [Vibrio cholerae]|uniref:hypothetical protein n=1 Tax=Vibrio cholerae TaxID=666 RepID=UPI00148DF186|nr:hypothetical protein [Vibrio cholerae]ELJ8739029.1 hypothetical protein [Vibrio cholerae]NOE85105.1 hypothetical protein [Vibrio cholerae]NOE97620.1 hypothetical protein [Vibrio cholerae]NOE97999.1 hypothetical protein [Vibrio cholerae]NOF13822.1 hypothetical protein [Vibrio cholerae]